MANETRYFKTPFAESGTRTEVPNSSVGGAVGFDTGFGPDYELPQGSSGRKRIERDKYNGLHHSITKNLKQWQENLYPTWIEDAGSGMPFSYPSNMVVNHNGDDWISGNESNTEEPGTGIQWSLYVPASQLSISGLTDLSFINITNLKSRTTIGGAVVTLVAENQVSTSNTKWQITNSATYSMPYANRVKVFNSLDIGGGLYAIPISSTIYASDFLDEAVTATNDDAVGEISSIMRDGLKLDFSGKMYRVYANTAGIPSSGATPATSRAQLLTRMLFMDDLRDISFGAGGLYAANQSTAVAKNYFPSTLYLKQCQDVHFDAGSTFESKGESWGDSDSSFTLTKDQRQDFLGQNGGHAIVAVRCKTITGSPTCRLSGSVGPLYFSSCEDVRLSDPFSNPSSLGYAAYSFDAWVGTIVDSGLRNFHGNISNPQAYAETLTRREDGAATGSGLYCGKGGVITEDTSVIVTTQGGYIADMYANGSAKTLGYAFGAGVRSKCTSVGAVVRNCQEVAYANVSAAGTSECVVTEVDAIVGLTGCMFDSQPFGICKITLKGKVRVNNSRAWSGEVETLANTSLVASMKTASTALAVIDCDAAADESPPSGSQGILFSLISNKNNATFGGVIIEGGEYVTNGYLIRSEGWGSSQAGVRAGLSIKAGVKIRDDSTAATDAYIQYTNKSLTNVFTYIYHDIENMDAKVRGFRSLSSGYNIQGTALVTMILFPRKLGITTYSTVAYRPRETLSVELTSIVGLTGPNTRLAFVMSDGRIPLGVNCWVTSQGVQHKVINIYTPTVSGPLRCDLVVENDVRSQFLAGEKYTIFGA